MIAEWNIINKNGKLNSVPLAGKKLKREFQKLLVIRVIEFIVVRLVQPPIIIRLFRKGRLRENVLNVELRLSRAENSVMFV
jgi:hypothetical protein